ncbi:BMC domain-containing protein [Tepidibacter sp.]|uniref:BMC domain-containing protein n=1 Tax=Tepidibacter sp. TaxID=2529387 RepID=UPI002ED17361
MSKFALGVIETVGLAAAIEAADTAVKSSNVKLLGYELTKGNGMVTVKIEGDVGAVNAAIQAGCAAAEKVNRVYSKTIIPRPHDEMHKLIITKETIKNMDSEENNLNEKQTDNIEEVSELGLETIVELEKNIEVKKYEFNEEEIKKDTKKVCNLCGDPACSRKKGEPRSSCIHYEEIKK